MLRSYLRDSYLTVVLLGKGFGESWVILMCNGGCELLVQGNRGDHTSLASDWLWKRQVPQSWDMEGYLLVTSERGFHVD